MRADRFRLLLLPLLIFAALAFGGEGGASPPAGVPITIGIALPETPIDDLLLEGARLAARQINDAGGIAGRPLVLVAERAIPPYKQGLAERIAADAGRELALRLAAHKPLAVIGHESTDGAISASQIYQDRNILFFSPYATNDSITLHRFNLVFRVTVPDRSINEAMSRYAYDQGYCRMLIFSERGEFGREGSLLFAQHAEDQGIDIAQSTSFQPDTENFQDLLLLLLHNDVFDANDIDAIFFVGTATQAGHFIREARRLKITQPILGSSAIYSPWTSHLAGEAMENVATHTLFDRQSPSRQRQDFVDAFQKEYGTEPSDWAAIAFDSVHLIAHAVKNANTLKPILLARHLRTLVHTTPYQGVTGSIAFDFTGELIDRAINVIRFKEGRFDIVARMPFSAAPFASPSTSVDDLKLPPTCRPH